MGLDRGQWEQVEGSTVELGAEWEVGRSSMEQGGLAGRGCIRCSTESLHGSSCLCCKLPRI